MFSNNSVWLKKSIFDGNLGKILFTRALSTLNGITCKKRTNSYLWQVSQLSNKKNVSFHFVGTWEYPMKLHCQNEINFGKIIQKNKLISIALKINMLGTLKWFFSTATPTCLCMCHLWNEREMNGKFTQSVKRLETQIWVYFNPNTFFYYCAHAFKQRILLEI